MPIRNSADVAFFLIGGFDVLGSLTQIEDSEEAILEPSHTLGDLWEEHTFVGVRKAEISQEGFYNDDVASVHDALSTGPGISRVLCYGVAGTATGAQFIGWEGAMQVNYERIIGREVLHKARATYRTNGAVEQHGRLVRMYGAHSATGRTTGTPLDGAASSSGGVGYFQWNATAGEVNARLLHSSDNITYATLFTFAKTVANSRGAERLTTTGIIERYTAADYTTASATGSIAALNSFMGLARGALSS